VLQLLSVPLTPPSAVKNQALESSSANFRSGMSTQACRIADADIWYNPVIIRILGHLPNFDSDISSFVEAQSHNLGMSWAGETEELLGI
jgi:hypothetical protein